jgi:hypothetical protein
MSHGGIEERCSAWQALTFEVDGEGEPRPRERPLGELPVLPNQLRERRRETVIVDPNEVESRSRRVDPIAGHVVRGTVG